MLGFVQVLFAVGSVTRAQYLDQFPATAFHASRVFASRLTSQRFLLEIHYLSVPSASQNN